MQANLALARINQTRAIAHALGMAFAKEGAGLPNAMRDELREACLPTDD